MADKSGDFSPFHSIVYIHHLPLTHLAPPRRSLINFKKTLDYTIRIGSTPTFLYFDLCLCSAYAAHYVYKIE